MSTADTSTPRDPGAGAVSTAHAVLTAPGTAPAPPVAWLRLLRSEFRLVFCRRRNLALLGVVGAIPVIVGIALRVAAPPSPGSGADGPAFLSQVAGNGVFLSFLALTVMLTLVLPLVVAVVSGDSVAGEASYGTLRYLLAVPAGRTGPVTLLSGTTVPLADGLLRLLFVTLYVGAAMAALAAIGMAISTFTEHGIGAIAALAVIVVASQVADNVPQFAPVQPYLPTHWWTMFDSLLRSPIDTTTLLHGLLSFAVYLAIFGSIAWARFTSADITS
jgi:ABC-2 type transport system permease protein